MRATGRSGLRGPLSTCSNISWVAASPFLASGPGASPFLRPGSAIFRPIQFQLTPTQGGGICRPRSRSRRVAIITSRALYSIFLRPHGVARSSP